MWSWSLLGLLALAAVAQGTGTATANEPKAIPAKGMSAQAIPRNAVPAKSIPKKAIPSKEIPDEATPAEAFDPAHNCVNMRNFDNYCQLNKRDCNSQDPARINYMHEYCAHTCGFCQVRTCYDHAYGCETLKHLCNDRREGPYIRQNCPKTCGTCTAVTLPTPPTTVPQTTPRPAWLCSDRANNCFHLAYACYDRQYYNWMTYNCPVTCKRCYLWPNCADEDVRCGGWAARGFCSNKTNPLQQKRELCAKTCGLCSYV